MAIIAKAEWKRVLPENKLARHQDEMRKTLHMHTCENIYRASQKKLCIAIPLLPGQGENIQQSEGNQGHNQGYFCELYTT